MSPQLFSDGYTYLDCGKPNQIFERQHILLRVIPNKSIDLLDKNLDWKDSSASIDLDEYLFSGVFGIYELKRESMELTIYPQENDYKIMKHTCQKTSKEKVETEIESIKSFKISKQKI